MNSLYLVLYYGDLEHGSIDRAKPGKYKPWIADQRAFGCMDDALAAIAADFPIVPQFDDEGVEDPLFKRREFPDPEDDRIIVWEIKEGETMKAVWRFSGWHWSDDEELGIPQGKLPGDKESLYELTYGDSINW